MTEPGVPLEHYRRHRGCGVLFHCTGCQKHWAVPIDDVVRRLEQRRLGGEQTGIKAVAQFVEKPCPRCGGFKFETRPGFGMIKPAA